MEDNDIYAKMEQAMVICDKLLPLLPDNNVFHFSYYAKEKLGWQNKDVSEITAHAPYIKRLMIIQLKYVDEVTQGQLYELNDKGREAKAAGGHYAYLKKLERDRQEKEKTEKYDFLGKKFIYKARYWPYIISFITIVLSVVSILIAMRALNTVK